MRDAMVLLSALLLGACSSSGSSTQGAGAREPRPAYDALKGLYVK